MAEYENAEQQLMAEGYFLTVLHGDSMWPMIRCRKDPVEILPLASCRPNGAQKNDVVVYRKSDRYVVHRVLKVCPDHYVIRGDNCSGLEIVPCDQVFGIVNRFWRNGKAHFVTSRTNAIYQKFLWLFHARACIKNILRR